LQLTSYRCYGEEVIGKTAKKVFKSEKKGEKLLFRSLRISQLFTFLISIKKGNQKYFPVER
jgi:hypothetical protein